MIMIVGRSSHSTRVAYQEPFHLSESGLQNLLALARTWSAVAPIVSAPTVSALIVSALIVNALIVSPSSVIGVSVIALSVTVVRDCPHAHTSLIHVETMPFPDLEAALKETSLITSVLPSVASLGVTTSEAARSAVKTLNPSRMPSA
eukprot:m.641139 g.641139  ORF g.641139 m.641139 type:complete len:147 (+) comp58345_c0_seq4:999-1439(+)